MNTTAQELGQYRTGQSLVGAMSFYQIEPESAQKDSTDLPTGPAMQFEIREYAFDELIQDLIEYERRFGMSTLELYARYLRGEMDHEEDLDDWISLYLLYLGTSKVREVACR